MRKTIRINFSDFDPGYEKTNNFFYHLLKKEYDVVIDELSPEYHFYSCFGHEYLKYDCIRIFYSGENDIPNFNLCDYALSFHHITFNDRHKRFPNFITYNQHNELLNRQRPGIKPEELHSRKFCNFIVSSTWSDPIRDAFYQRLSEYKKIDSPGKVFNNMTLPASGKGWHFDKIDFMNQYKFSITFENSSMPGYTTEKLVHAFVSNTIPVYWGNPLIGQDFNTRAFINCHEYDNMEAVIDKIKELDANDDAYIEMLNQPLFSTKELPDYYNEEYLLSFFRHIFLQPYQEATRRCKYGFSGSYAIDYKKALSDAKAFQYAKSGLKGYAGLLKEILKDRLS
jgi:alpha(1,3/1,4) fucosyltransferase